MFYLVLILLIVNVAAVGVYAYLLKKVSAGVALFFLMLVFLNAVFIGLYTAFNFDGGAGVGVLFYYLTCINVPGAFFLLWTVRHRFAQFNDNRLHNWLFWIGSVTILILQLAPLMGNFLVGGYCDTHAIRAGNEVVTLVDKFNTEKGHYPGALGELVPEYYAAVPVFSCFGQGTTSTGFLVRECPDGTTLLTFQAFNGSQTLRYDFSNPQWNGIPLSDDVCAQHQ